MGDASADRAAAAATSACVASRNPLTGTRTILGFGSLLSIRSAQTTFPELTNFRVVRVKDFQRVFGHPGAIFFERGIAKLATKEFAAVCCYKHVGDAFLAVAFEVTDLGMDEFYKREHAFELVDAAFEELDSKKGGFGMLCTNSTDAAYVAKWGQEAFDNRYTKHGVETLWGFDQASGILPCRIYLRHCVLAAENLGQEVYDDFLDNTFLADRSTTIRTHLERDASIMAEEPPGELRERYGG
mmetsp:Transcript_39590/g.93284  ORF Transcript_39590/g.93284 Transcript_39590/m.93284 type:complete len:242 (-) Transcript_39590:171-896(-)